MMGALTQNSAIKKWKGEVHYIGNIIDPSIHPMRLT